MNQDSVSAAFRELQNELQNEFGSSTCEAKGGGRQSEFDWMTLIDSLDEPNNPFLSTVDKKTAKKWIEKAFDFAFEFNDDFATVPGERDATEEFLRKSRDWVARLYEEEEEEGEKENENESEPTKNSKEDDSSSSDKSNPRVSTETNVSNQEQKSPPQIVSETPASEDRSDKDVFLVSVDLPGVDRTNVDIILDGDFLLIRAKRDTENDGQPTRIYATKLAFPENGDMEKLEANLNNGVLTISAPKKQKPIEGKRKIPVL